MTRQDPSEHAPPRSAPPVRYREVIAKSLTRLRGTVGPWFLGRYGMNLYRGCEHVCASGDLQRVLSISSKSALETVHLLAEVRAAVSPERGRRQ